MKTKLEIDIKKIRRQLSQYGLTEEEKSLLRETLTHLKALRAEEKKNVLEKN